MSDFKAKMHQIRCRLGLCPRPLWGSLQRSPDPLAGFKGPTSKERGEEGKGREGREGRGERGGEGRGAEGTGGKGREVDTPNFYLDRRLWFTHLFLPLLC